MVFEKVESEYEYWKHENADDEIMGEFVRFETDKGAYKSTIYHINVKDQNEIKKMVVFGSTVLNDKMTFVNVGDTIKIVYKGMVEGKKEEYKDYDVFVDK